MNFRIDWIDGAPEKLEPGMVLKSADGDLRLVGNISTKTSAHPCAMLDWDLRAVCAWGWLVQPHELEWIADMAQRHGKGRPQE
ncbi:hypothetical protein [Pseudomonas sp. zfem003]|uniref:hypothetical protein n=1 Tax=Pseudomonas sp. zfem003 TaxID=3078198 RepID=UPI002927AC8D|nr:hypothetical protein [Pseudomonas sp. zfem003]MDU9398053.1 hypothetical protein [Pseudomonas sp. zfem003]